MASPHYLIVAGPEGAKARDGSVHPAGTVFNRIVWDGKGPFIPRPGCIVIPDDGRDIYQPASRPPTTITVGAFLDRFTVAEQGAVQIAAAAAPATLGLGLTRGLAVGMIDLTSPALLAWMEELVVANVLTAARKMAILTP